MLCPYWSELMKNSATACVSKFLRVAFVLFVGGFFSNVTVHAQQKTVVTSEHAKVRAITAFINLDREQYKEQIAEAIVVGAGEGAAQGEKTGGKRGAATGAGSGAAAGAMSAFEAGHDLVLDKGTALEIRLDRNLGVPSR